MVKDFRIWSSFTTRTVPVGTDVWFRAMDKGYPGTALSQKYRLSWEVRGPFPDEVVTEGGQQQADPAVFTLRTDGLRPGTYEVTCTRTELTAHPPAPAHPEAPPRPPHEGLLGVATGLPRPQPGGEDLPDETDLDPSLDAAHLPLRLTPATGSTNREGVVPVSLQRTATVPTADQVLWMIIRNRTDAISFPRYKRFLDGVMCGKTTINGHGGEELQYRGTGAYELLCRATDAFLMQEMGVITDTMIRSGEARMSGDLDGPAWAALDALGPEELALRETSRLGYRPSRDQIEAMRKEYFQLVRDESLTLLPYMDLIRDRLSDIPLKGPGEVSNCYGILRSRISEPLAIELIWSYWHEEGMLVQTMNAILARFQNRKLRAGPDPLARLDIDPLRPLGNLIWGWAQDEYGRLTVVRRSSEYDHEYGLRLTGQALRPPVETVDRRHKFLEAFHNLLFLSHVFFKEDDDTTVIADGFPVLNALRETHLLLAEGAHNQYGDLPSTARAEMLIMEWLLARPEMREFLGGRVMVPYAESWMDRVDTVKTMERWTDVSVTYFRDLAVYGEQILLSIRFGNWSVVNDPQQAANWARYWRPEIQRYAHGYRAATGVDLTERADATIPTLLLQRRLVSQRRA